MPALLDSGSITMRLVTPFAMSWAASAISTRAWWTMSVCAALSFNWWAISRSRYPEFMVVATAPTFMMP